MDINDKQKLKAMHSDSLGKFITKDMEVVCSCGKPLMYTGQHMIPNGSHLFEFNCKCENPVIRIRPKNEYIDFTVNEVERKLDRQLEIDRINYERLCPHNSPVHTLDESTVEYMITETSDPPCHIYKCRVCGGKIYSQEKLDLAPKGSK